jgi:uncharacterized protein (DUF433 family)
MELREIGEHLVIDPRVCHGKMTFKGTRVPVETILNRLATGRTFEDLMESWPEVGREAIVEAAQLAVATLLEKYPQVRPEARREPAHPGRSTRRQRVTARTRAVDQGPAPGPAASR